MRQSAYGQARVTGLIAIVSIVGTQLVARDARAATVTTSYPATGCRGATWQDEDRLEHFGSLLTNISVDPAEVVCPIVKKTSGPGASDDWIQSISIQGLDSSIICKLTDYSVHVSAMPQDNVVALGPAVPGSGEHYTIVLGGNGTTRYWDGLWNDGRFIYAEVSCTMQGLSNIGGYTVVEHGSTKTGRRIVSAAYCTPNDIEGTYHFNTGGTDGTDPALNGFLDQDGRGFGASCPMPSGAGAKVQIWLGVPLSGSMTRMGCRIGSGTPQFVSGLSEEVKPLVFNAGGLFCFEEGDPPNGDGRVFAYRTASSF